MKKQNESWNEYLNNKNVRPKTFNVTMQRDKNGQFVVVGHQALMKVDANEDAKWVKVNSRALVEAIATQGIVAR